MMEIFVFGSNLAGIHGVGAAKTAYEHHGAIWGCGVGRQGNSYAIPTKDYTVVDALSLDDIAYGVWRFTEHALYNWEDRFIVTRVACGYSRYRDADIAPLFKMAPDNCLFDEKWKQYLPDRAYWGTHGRY